MNLESEIVELDLTEKENEKFVRSYITEHMNFATLERYIEVLNTTDSLAEACLAAITNEFIIEVITKQITKDCKDVKI